MLKLNSDTWANLEHAYGSAEDIPTILTVLAQGEDKWFDIWSALCHQGTIYTATFAAMPHIIKVFEANLEKADFNTFVFATSVELTRQDCQVQVPDTLNVDYFQSLEKLDNLVQDYMKNKTDFDSLVGVLAFQAIRKFQTQLAQLILNLNEEQVPAVLEWYWNQ